MFSITSLFNFIWFSISLFVFYADHEMCLLSMPTMELALFFCISKASIFFSWPLELDYNIVWNNKAREREY